MATVQINEMGAMLHVGSWNV